MIFVRRAESADSAIVFDWRNDEDTRAASVSHEVVEWSDHQQWFSAALDDSRRFLYIACEAETADAALVGLCRFDLSDDGDTAEVSINLNPVFRGRGLARQVLEASIEGFRRDAGVGTPLTATIRPENTASVRTFEGLGFVLSDADAEFSRYRL
jgi:RimJ/RimL family protein N-acetyltransferase